MKNRFLAFLLATTVVCLGAMTACASTQEDMATSGVSADRADTIYQVALLQSLTQGYFDGIITVGELKEHGDTGIGTFEGVNGEMIVLDGTVYQAVADGSIATPSDTETVPFSNVTFFDVDETLALSDIEDMAALQETMNGVVNRLGANCFYMVKIDGIFGSIKVRSEYKQEKPYRALDVALAADQTEFDYEDIQGTMVGLYCPDYMGDLNSIGWHFHFITEDRTRGGHVLQVSVKEAEAAFDMTDGFEMTLSRNSEFQGMDLAKDVDEAIHKAETATVSASETAATENETVEAKEFPETLPEDNGDMIGVYKWVEMADSGVNAYLVIWDGGIGIIDMLGVVETVKYDDDTMQSSGEGALPQSYIYKDGTLTWTAIGDDEGQVSTFVKLTAEELAEYQVRGIGNTE